MTKRSTPTLAELIRAARAAAGEKVRITVDADMKWTIEPIVEGERKGKEAALAPKREIVL